MSSRFVSSAFVALTCLTAELINAGNSPAQSPQHAANQSQVVASLANSSEPAGRAGHNVAADNPKVEPGLVRWHPSFAAACAAAKKSGKPVLLFQMMGRLDEQFC
jgi:hypothetical protein